MAHGCCAHPNAVGRYGDSALRASQRSTTADGATWPGILLPIPPAERLVLPTWLPQRRDRKEANDRNSGCVTAIRCLVLPGPGYPNQPNPTQPRGRQAARGHAGILGRKTEAQLCDRRQARRPCATSAAQDQFWSWQGGSRGLSAVGLETEITLAASRNCRAGVGGKGCRGWGRRAKTPCSGPSVGATAPPVPAGEGQGGAPRGPRGGGLCGRATDALIKR